MNSTTKYKKWIKGTCKSEGVDVDEEEAGGGCGGHVFILRGKGQAVEAVMHKWRTEKVDVNKKGEPCKERMAVFEEIDV
ncbi:hypothetical protein TrRE_jg3451 [Triparma retinervis]|uniref:Uncharacterized protein n=1 Tax=Triparma retinervis TaxID=2557542 RepID=A0A9W7DSF2_9STRA|nr:hypothetical protein TrRE_jg3451 [Triparma retinervis]